MSKSSSLAQLSSVLFYKVYLVLVISIIIIGSILDYFINQIDNASYFQHQIDLYKPILILINDKLSDSPAKDIQTKADELAKQFDLSLSLLELNGFAGDKSITTELSSGEIVTLYNIDDSLSLYLQINNSRYILELEVEEKQIDIKTRWVPLIFYLLIAFVVFLMTRPFANQLMKLKKAAINIGQGNFDTRLTMPKNSTLYPISDAFDTMTQEIDTLMTRQRDLINAVSHELRTPLARLKFAFEELSSHSEDDNWINNINEMRADVTELELLIDEMLRYAEAVQIDAFSKKPVYLKRLINDLFQSMRPGEINLGKYFTNAINSDFIIYGDEHSLFRALSNILRNSISFAETKCNIEVSSLKNKIIINISDDGPGIESKLVKRIFEPFVKLNTKKRKSGYGLGLAIAKNIITKHKGEIRIVQGNLKGACFQIIFPKYFN